MIFRESDIMYAEEWNFPARKMIIAPLIGRRIIQKYIGNLFNAAHWFQSWLNECFIMFLQAYIIDEVVFF